MISARRYWFVVVACIAFGLFVRHESLSYGFYADDLAQIGMLERIYPLQRSAYDLFRFSDGSLAESQRLMEVGFYPWWTDPELRLVMLRPLASGMMWLDHRLFGHDPLGYHLHSAFWWCALQLVIAMFFRQVLQPLRALVAFALLSCSAVLATPLWWICNRSEVMATLLSALALYWHVRAYRDGSSRHARLAVVTFAFAFLFGEYAFCALGYFFAFEFCNTYDSTAKRARRLAAMIAPAIVFLIVRSVDGATVRGSGIYIDPAGEPFAFLEAAFARIPIFIADELFHLPADHWSLQPHWLVSWVQNGWVSPDWLHNPTHWRSLHLAIGLIAGCAWVLLYRAVQQTQAGRQTRWLPLGSLLSMLPVTSSFPSSRLLLLPLIGFTPLLSAFIMGLFATPPNAAHRSRVVQLLCSTAAMCGLTYHIAVPIWSQRALFGNPYMNGRSALNAILDMDVDEERLPGQDIVLLNAVEGGTSMYLPMTRVLHGLSGPRSCTLLSLVVEPYLLTRESATAFSIRFEHKVVMLRTPLEQLFRRSDHRLRLGQTTDVGNFRATVTELYEGLPRRVRFEFARPLEAPTWLFMIPQQQGFRRFELPPIGATVVVPAPHVPMKAERSGRPHR